MQRNPETGLPGCDNTAWLVAKKCRQDEDRKMYCAGMLLGLFAGIFTGYALGAWLGWP